MTTLTQEYVKSIFTYDPSTGIVQWKQPKHGRQSYKPVGTEKREFARV